MLTTEEHNVLAQLAQLGLQRLGEVAQSAINKIAPPEPRAEVPAEDPIPKGKTK